MAYAKTHKMLVLLSGLLVIFIILLIYVFFLPSTAVPPAQIPNNPINEKINPQGDTLLFESDQFSIEFQPAFNKYLITIVATPFETIRKDAENKFLEVTGFSKDEACTKNVSVGTIISVDEQRAGKIFGLSFCLGKITRPTPQLTPIQNNLPQLSAQKINPASGTVDLGTTKNSISITFSAAVDPTTTQVIITPALPAFLTVHPKRQNELVVVPQAEWQTGQNYTVTIKAGLLAKDKQSQLKTDIVLNYTVTEVVLPEIQGEI
mgnify:FL=1